MSFFDPPPPPPEPLEEPQPPWTGPPGNELGVAVPIRYVVVRTDDLAILLDGFVAFSTGVELSLSVKSRQPRRDAHEFHRLRDDVRLGFRFADGRKATNIGRDAADREHPETVLWHRGGHGGGGELHMRWWLWPLPPPGPLGAVVAWDERGVPETEVAVDGDAILAAAARAELLWPGDAPRGGGWTSYASVSARRTEPGQRDG
jgi:hypothetical protein